MRKTIRKNPNNIDPDIKYMFNIFDKTILSKSNTLDEYNLSVEERHINLELNDKILNIEFSREVLKHRYYFSITTFIYTDARKEYSTNDKTIRTLYKNLSQILLKLKTIRFPFLYNIQILANPQSKVDWATYVRENIVPIFNNTLGKKEYIESFNNFSWFSDEKLKEVFHQKYKEALEESEENDI